LTNNKIIILFILKLKGGAKKMTMKVLIIGAGGVGSVVAHKCAQVPEVFSQIILASRTVGKCEEIAKSVSQRFQRDIEIDEVDADNVEDVVELIREYEADIVINVALPYQDLHIMEACLEAHAHYVDTANYEPPDEAKFCYEHQWAYHERFKKQGLMALLGSGFDPGVTNVFVAWAAKNRFDEIHELDILDCNAGNHGKIFATNFNPEINIREVTQNPRYWENGKWVETKPILDAGCVHMSWDYPEIGPRESFLLYHEELQSLVKHFPSLHQAKFWMTFSQKYIDTLKLLQEIGITGIFPISAGESVIINGKVEKKAQVIPLKFLKSCLPDPSSLAHNYTGKTNIGCFIGGVLNEERRIIYIYNICDHAKCYAEVGSQAISYTTGVPAMIGAMLIAKRVWRDAGVFNLEQLDPDPFMAALNKHGLPWTEMEIL
jgi:saccharopine dehydrogenase (NAD+, L-lysine-forming)